MLKVAIAEDDYRIASIHEHFLSKVDGTKVVFKSLNAKETLIQLKEHAVDLLLLDIYMPDALGIHIIEKMKAIQPNLGIIIISAGNDKHLVQQVLQKGVFDYMIKPVKMERFIETVEKYKKFKEELNRKEEVDQAFLDQYFGRTRKQNQENEMPKGIDPLTLQKVESILNEYDGITAEKMGEEMGASRTTARRYLEYLISIDQCYAELEYGIVGRPERKYFRKEKAL